MRRLHPLRVLLELKANTAAVRVMAFNAAEAGRDVTEAIVMQPLGDDIALIYFLFKRGS
jgi:hypothetical protein